MKEIKMKLKEKEQELKLNELKVKELKSVVPKHRKFLTVGENLSNIDFEREGSFYNGDYSPT